MGFSTKTRLAAALTKFWSYGLGQAIEIAGKALQGSANGLPEVFQTQFSASQSATIGKKIFPGLAIELLSRVGVHPGAPRHLWVRAATHIRARVGGND